MSRLLPIILALFWVPLGHPADVSPALQQAAAALQRGDFSGAEAKLRAELKLHPNDAETLSLLGFALDSQKKLAEADSLHRRAAAAAAPSARVQGRYGNHLLIAGNEKGARDAFLKAIAIDPLDRYSNLQLVQLALKTNDAEAGALFARLSAATQNDATLSASIGWALTEARRYEHCFLNSG